MSSSKFLGERKKVTVRHMLPLEMCSCLHRDNVPTVFSGDIYNIFMIKPYRRCQLICKNYFPNYNQFLLYLNYIQFHPGRYFSMNLL